MGGFATLSTGSRRVPERFDRLTESLARDSSRRGFLARVGGALMAVTAARTVGTLIEPGDSDAFHFCGHIFTTGSCPHPNGLPRIDARGYPMRSDGRPIDNIGRLVNGDGEPVNDDGHLLRDPDGRPLPPAPRTRLCQEEVSRRFGFRTWVDGGWYRCCDGHVRKLVDCCAYSNRRINGDEALEGYCYRGRKVFCVMFFQTGVPC